MKREGSDQQASPHLQFSLGIPLIHRVVLRFLLAAGKKQLPYSDMVGFPRGIDGRNGCGRFCSTA